MGSHIAIIVLSSEEITRLSVVTIIRVCVDNASNTPIEWYINVAVLLDLTISFTCISSDLASFCCDLIISLLSL